MGHVDFFEAGMGHDNRVPIAGSHTAEKALPVLFGEIGLFRDQNIRVRIQPEKFIFLLI
jgi:hypothetical protein